MSFAEIKAHQEGVYELALTSSDGLDSFKLEKLELIGNSVVASFQNKTVGADSYKISLGSVNTNISPLQQIHDPAKMQTDSRLSGLLRDNSDQLDDQHFVRPTRPALGHHYYRQPESSRLYLNNSLSSALPFTDNASAGMQDVVATSAIFQNHDKLPGLSDPNPQPLHPLTTTASGKIVLSVVFSAADTQLGLTAGTTSLLKANPNNTLAKIFLPPVPKRDAVGQSFTFKGFEGEVGQSPEGLSASNTLWFSAKDDLIGILNQKQDQFSVDMPFDSRGLTASRVWAVIRLQI